MTFMPCLDVVLWTAFEFEWSTFNLSLLCSNMMPRFKIVNSFQQERPLCATWQRTLAAFVRRWVRYCHIAPLSLFNSSLLIRPSLKCRSMNHYTTIIPLPISQCNGSLANTIHFADKMLKTTKSCNCNVPCTRVTYEPSLSYAHLSKYNIDRAVLSESRQEYVKGEWLWKVPTLWCVLHYVKRSIDQTLPNANGIGLMSEITKQNQIWLMGQPLTSSELLPSGMRTLDPCVALTHWATRL